MIKEYIRPDSIEESISILQKDPSFRPLAGGSTFNQSKDTIKVVDLQNCGLRYIRKDTGMVQIGSMATLEQIRVELSDFPAIVDAINIEASRNIREQATLGGTIISTNGRSPLLTVLLGLDAELIWQPGSRHIRLGDWLAQKKTWKEGVLISEIELDLSGNSQFESIGRSPMDTPVLCSMLCTWSGKRMRLAIGGFGDTPTLIMDGLITDDLEIAIKSALTNCNDEWASAEYRTNAAITLAKRSLQNLVSKEDK